MITFTRSVGSAPATTTMALSRLGACPPDVQSISQKANQAAAARMATKAFANRGKPVIATFYRPYGDDVSMRGGLGAVLSPMEINRTIASAHKPGDWYAGPTALMTNQYTRGESDYYYDSPLGAVPTDDELARARGCYTPVHSGWINSLGFGSPQSIAVGAFGVDTPDVLTPPTGGLSKYQQYALMLSFVSTAAIVASSAIAMYRNMKATGYAFPPTPPEPKTDTKPKDQGFPAVSGANLRKKTKARRKSKKKSKCGSRCNCGCGCR